MIANLEILLFYIMVIVVALQIPKLVKLNKQVKEWERKAKEYDDIQKSVEHIMNNLDDVYKINCK